MSWKKSKPTKPKFNIYRDGWVHVMREECATCIFNPRTRPLSGSRVAGIVKNTLAEDGSTVVCHHTLSLEETGGQQQNAVCRGWFDRLGDKDLVIRLAKAMQIIQEQ